jgi:8-oxo-dGTP diphosphatase
MSEYIRRLRLKIGHELLFMPGATGIVIDEAGQVLLHRRSDNGQWWLPGGAIDPGEEPADAVVREVWEETGVRVVPERVLGVYGGLDHFGRYPNGDEIGMVSVVFVCRPVGGEPAVNDEESLEVRYFLPDALPELLPRHRSYIELALRGDVRADFRFTFLHHRGQKNNGKPSSCPRRTCAKGCRAILARHNRQRFCVRRRPGRT